MLIILIALAALIGLIVLHELGHFLLAKRFGVKVEEFGIGIPPRIFGVKFGETVYSLNLLPIGAFVKLYGEENQVKDPRSFTAKSVWQRALIIVAGVVMFWLAAFVIFAFIAGMWGVPTAVSDDANGGLTNPKVQIISISPDSPAEKAGVKMGDVIKQLSVSNYQLSINKVSDVQKFTEENEGKEITLTVQRGDTLVEMPLTPRISPPEGEGAMGIALQRVAIQKYSWTEAPAQGVRATINTTSLIAGGLAQIVKNIMNGNSSDAKVMGPVGIFSLFSDFSKLGAAYFLQFIAVIAINLGIINLLPIPALDGGKLAFLGIEAIRGKPINPRVEEKLTSFFFMLLILLMLWVTVKDVINLF